VSLEVTEENDQWFDRAWRKRQPHAKKLWSETASDDLLETIKQCMLELAKRRQIGGVLDLVVKVFPSLRPQVRKWPK
jgi:hypothetical protein